MSSQRNSIFLSYRRDDIPGYVGRLSDDLEALYGTARVFRDVDDLKVGENWKEKINEALGRSAVLILMIGPRWCEIWRQRAGEPVNYVALELALARENGVTIFPVTLGGASLEYDLDLGDIEWLREIQQHDISDRQQRWEHDVKALIHAVAQVPGMFVPEQTENKPLPPDPPEKNAWRKRALAAAVALVLFVGIGYMMFGDFGKKTIPLPKPAPDGQPSGQPEALHPLMPRIQGTWESQNGKLSFQFKPVAGNRFNVIVPGKGRGSGKVLIKMPGKIAFKVIGLGEAEFSLSNSGDKMTGWYRTPGSSQSNYATLTRKSQ